MRHMGGGKSRFQTFLLHFTQAVSLCTIRNADVVLGPVVISGLCLAVLDLQLWGCDFLYHPKNAVTLEEQDSSGDRSCAVSAQKNGFELKGGRFGLDM